MEVFRAIRLADSGPLYFQWVFLHTVGIIIVM